MPLEEYREKRRFGKTPEPAGKVGAGEGPLRFVVQKHDASRLHYDFRLEMEGVLKSWAVPKGPSLDTADKRLAVQVEDHPLEYGDFEGVIPEGEYGGGTVMVWDAGTYTPRGDLRAMHEKGDLKVDLAGSKLQGGFALVRMKRRPGEKQDNWLLIKERDGHTRPSAEYNVLEAQPDSVKTGRTMAQIAAAGVESTVGGADGGGGKVQRNERDLDPSRVNGAFRALPPDAIAPELATKVAVPPVGDEWLHEIKLDGYRVLCRIDGDDVRFFTRSGADWTDRFVALVASVRGLGVSSAWFDGEMTVLLPDGRTSFGALTAELGRGSKADLTYHVFDLLHLDGFDLREAELVDRKSLLERLLARGGARLRYVDHVQGRGSEFHRQACAYALEGSVSKRAGSEYRSGRGRDWQKVTCTGREDFAVVGFTPPASGGDGIGALVLAAVSPSGALAYVGRVGTGWTEAEGRALRHRLERLRAEEPFVAVSAGARKGVVWTRPEVLASVTYAGWTGSGALRHASYDGVREDVDAPVSVAEVAAGPKAVGGSAAKKASAHDDETVAGVRLTHPDKVVFGTIGVTKRELARYYERVAEWVLPHLAERPLVLVRCPEGESGQCFYQKNVETGFPASVGRVAVEHDEGTVHYALVDSVEGLVALVQLGVLEIHTWGSRADDVERPDRIILDLDPGPGVAWHAVVDAAVVLKQRLEAAGFTAFAKTTGGKGLHVVTPIVRGPEWQRVRDVARAIANDVSVASPDLYTTNPLKERRQGRIFVDYIRNTRGATAVAAYSTRARPGAPVSVPVRWDELAAGVRSDGYDIRSTPHRLAALGRDPWEGYEASAASLEPAERQYGLG